MHTQKPMLPASHLYAYNLCCTEEATKAWHRQERQQRHKQIHQQAKHAATKQPTNKTKTYATVTWHNTHQQALRPDGHALHNA